MFSFKLKKYSHLKFKSLIIIVITKKMVDSKEKLNSSNNLDQILNNKIIPESMNILLPRDVLNANTLLSSQNSINKYFWEEDGEKVTL